MSSLPWDKSGALGNLEAIFAGGFKAREPEQDDRPERLGSWTSYALTYAAMNWPIIPLHTVADGRCSCGNPTCSSPGKHPRTRNGLHDASTDRATILGWGERWPDSNLAIVTGSASGVWALDVDARHGGLDTLADLIDRHGPLPDTPMAITGGGGQHWLFRHAEGVRNRAGIAPGIDVRGEGGYIAVEPSVHASGNAYAWEASSDPTDGLAPVSAPEWLMAMVVADAPRQAAPVAAGAIAEGGRNNALASLAGTMRRAGMGREAIEAALVAENDQRCVPPLPRQEVERIAWSIARKEPEQDYGELAQVDTSALIEGLKARKEQSPQEPLASIRGTDWAGEAAPQREWLVQDWMPMRQTTALYAKGGTGKTLAVQQLLTAVSSGTQWFGLDVRQGPAVGVFCEDDADELHRRQESINDAMGIPCGDLADLHIIPRVGHDNLLMTFDSHGRASLTAFWRELYLFVEKVQPALLVIDTAADTFGGNENIRPQVRQYVQQALTQLATRHNCAVVLCAHPSASGISSGEGTGGSTAWENSVRSRLYMDRSPDTHIITLTRKKSNYSATGDAFELVWHEGAIKPAANLDALIDQTTDSINQRIERDFFTCLDHMTDKQRQKASPAKNGGNYAPKAFAQIGQHLRPPITWSPKQFEAAMTRLLDQGRLVTIGDSKRGMALSRPGDLGLGSSGECSASD